MRALSVSSLREGNRQGLKPDERQSYGKTTGIPDSNRILVPITGGRGERPRGMLYAHRDAALKTETVDLRLYSPAGAKPSGLPACVQETRAKL